MPGCAERALEPPGPPRLPQSLQVRGIGLRRDHGRGPADPGRAAARRKTADITVGTDTYQISIEDDITITGITAARQSSRDIRRHKASNYRPALGSSTPVP